MGLETGNDARLQDAVARAHVLVIQMASLRILDLQRLEEMEDKGDIENEFKRGGFLRYFSSNQNILLGAMSGCCWL